MDGVSMAIGLGIGLVAGLIIGLTTTRSSLAVGLRRLLARGEVTAVDRYSVVLSGEDLVAMAKQEARRPGSVGGAAGPRPSQSTSQSTGR